MDRRSFITNTGMAAVAMTLPKTEAPGLRPQNKLPQWKGFNLLDFFSPDPSNSRGVSTGDHFRWMQDWGFNFTRIPIAYPYYLDIDRSKNITPEEGFETAIYHYIEGSKTNPPDFDLNIKSETNKLEEKKSDGQKKPWWKKR